MQRHLFFPTLIKINPFLDSFCGVFFYPWDEGDREGGCERWEGGGEMEGRGLASHLVVNSVLKSSDPSSHSLSPWSIAMKIISHSTWISLSKGYPSDFPDDLLLPIYNPGWRETLWTKVLRLRTQHNDPARSWTNLVSRVSLLPFLSLSSQKEGKKRDLRSKVGLEPKPLHLKSSALII